MKTKFSLFLLLSFFSISTSGQEFDFEGRCQTIFSEPSDLFEDWLHNIQEQSLHTRNEEVYLIPMVIHILHMGEPLGEGYNYSRERVLSQMEVINEDFRRQIGTPGHNNHPDGGDAKIEFVLAKTDPDGQATDGIVRINMLEVDVPPISLNNVLLASKFSYWDPENYLNVWSMPFPGIPFGFYLGEAKFPISGLDGLPDSFDPEDADGIVINAANFGRWNTDIDPNFDMGRTLTHELGHFLGLLHVWGKNGQHGSCEEDDFCEDTPPTAFYTSGCPATPPLACDGQPAMIENYMEWTHDRCMNIFTNDQIARMRKVLEHSPRRKSLLTSPGLHPPDSTITSIPEIILGDISIYPNPVVDKVYFKIAQGLDLQQMEITAYSISGRVIFSKRIDYPLEEEVILDIPKTSEKLIILQVVSDRFQISKKLIVQQ